MPRTGPRQLCCLALACLLLAGCDDDEDSAGPLPSVMAEKTATLSDDVDFDGLVDPGDTILYRIEIRNSGEAEDGLGISFRDTPPSDVTLIAGSVVASQGTVVAGNSGGDVSVHVEVGDVAAGAVPAVIEFSAFVDDPLSPGLQYISNQGEIEGAEFETRPTDDPDRPGRSNPTLVPVDRS